MFLENIAHEIK